MHASAFRLDGGSWSEFEHRCLLLETGRWGGRLHGEFYLVLVALYDLERIRWVCEPQIQPASCMYVCLLDVAFGIEWFFLEARGEGSDATH